MKTSGRYLFVIALGSTATTLSAQTPPFGAEIQVTKDPSGIDPALAFYGGLAVVWDNGDVFGRRFSASLAGSAQFPVNTYTTYRQGAPAVAAGGGGLVVVWESYSEDGDDLGIFGQRFQNGPGGSVVKAGPEFLVNSYTTGYQEDPLVGADAAGNFVVVWSGEGAGGDRAIFGRQFDASGSPTTGDFRVNTSTSDLLPASLSVHPDGSFVVVWAASEGPGDTDIFGQRFDASGSRVGTEFRVNSYTTGVQTYPGVAGDSSGNFVVVWQSDVQDSSTAGIFGQRFNSAGERIGSEFQVNTYTPSAQTQASIAVDPSGAFVVVWESLGQDGQDHGIFGQRFDRNGQKAGSEFLVNVVTAGDQVAPVVLQASDGLSVAWGSVNDAQIYLRRQSFLPNPSRMKVDAHSGTFTSSDLNGVFEPGETVLVETGWEKTGGLGLTTLTGTASGLTGPPGPLYLIAHASANFGDVGLGGAPDCYDATPMHECYVFGVAGARPAAHWDATFEEDISAGGGEPRVLHIGESFTDVPRSEPFYAKIETLLHNGITSGCTETTYCPSDPVPRDQMAIFVAKAIAGSGPNVPTTGTVSGILFGQSYNCSAGGQSLFTDIAPTDPSCRHIHYLASENVTLGCGDFRYCPSGTVTRDAMASFIAKAIVAPGGGAAVPTTYGPDPGTGFSYSCDAGSPNTHFIDVPVSNPFCKHIHFLWAKGIVSGCSATQYCPTQTVARDAMAKFIANGFGLQLYAP